jgi:hypothetical protein
MDRELHRLDPDEDAHRICLLAFATRFPAHQFPFHLYYTLFFVRATAPPKSSVAMDRDGAGMIYRPGNPRATNTTADIFEWMAHGPHSDIGAWSINRVKRIHDKLAPRWGGFPNHVMLYTLCCDVLAPDRFMALIGGPRFDAHERAAQLAFWQRVGAGLGIEGIPDTWEGMVTYAAEYERSEHFVSSDYGQRAARRFVEEFGERWAPPLLQPFARRFILALCEPRTLEIHELEPPGKAFTFLVRRLLALSIHIQHRFMPDPPDGYNPGALFHDGPPAGCPVAH